MPDKLTLNVAISAYNEAFNIGSLLKLIFEQEEINFILNKVILISDGSSDSTVSEAKKIADPRLHIIDRSDRKGKAGRVPELLSLSDSDILVLLDADVKLENKFVFSELAKEIAQGADLVFPKIAPLEPRSHVEKVSHFGIYAWEKVLDQMAKELTIKHRCTGRCRAFSKKLYKNFYLPVEADGVEDVYSFCFAITNGYKTAYNPKALIRYRLPSTTKDFVKQARRYVRGSDSLSKFYDRDLVLTYEPTERMKLIALMKSFFRFLPHITLTYITLQLYARKTSSMQDQKPVYDYLNSTKQL